MLIEMNLSIWGTRPLDRVDIYENTHCTKEVTDNGHEFIFFFSSFRTNQQCDSILCHGCRHHLIFLSRWLNKKSQSSLSPHLARHRRTKKEWQFSWKNRHLVPQSKKKGGIMYYLNRNHLSRHRLEKFIKTGVDYPNWINDILSDLMSSGLQKLLLGHNYGKNRISHNIKYQKAESF